MKKILLLLALVTTTAWGQQFSVTGRVTDGNSNEPLEYATIVLEPIQNPKGITGGVTDPKGNFKIEAPKGIYHIKIQFFSYKTYEIKNFNLSENKNLGNIILKEDITDLDGVTLTAERTTVELHLDKKIYNVGQDMTVKGGSVSDVLDNVPSVSVDVEGKVSLRGNENVRILINGKPSALSGMNDEALRQLPAESIEKVEVITNPSSRYDAEGTAGIINIILKKGSAIGFMGSSTLTLGHPDNYAASVNLNLRKRDWTFFNNTAYSYRNSPGYTAYNQQNFDTSTGLISNYQDEYRATDRLRKGLNINLGAEYRFNDKTSITNTIIYGNRNSDDLVKTDYANYNSNKVLTVKRYRDQNETGTDHRFQYAFNFEHRFNEAGHKLTADYQFSTSKENEEAIITETVLTTNTHLPTEKIINKDHSKSHLVQVDYVLPIGKDKKTQFEAGYRATIDDNNIDYTVGTINALGHLSINPNFSNEFAFDQIINAFYSQFGTKKGKWNFMGGLRLEHTQLNSTLKTTGEDFSKNYAGLFPSIYIGHEFSENQQLSLSYSRRLRRPWSRFINPFVSRSSSTNLFGGNPDIDPTYTNAYEVAYLKRWDKFSLNSSVYYNHSTQVFEMIALETGNFVEIVNPQNPSQPISVPVMLRRPINLSDEDRLGVEFTATYTPKTSWRFMWNVNFFHSKTAGNYSYVNYLGNIVNQNFDTQDTSWSTRLTAKLPLPYKIDFQTNISYSAPRKSAQSEREGMLAANLALSKEVLNKKGTLSLNVSDLFNSQKMVADTRTKNVFSHSEMQWRKRQILLNFTYRFGNMKMQQKQRRQQDFNADDANFEF
ncbi:TonB-dependent receptor domain-containing protein [Capnocytophaga canimorsus]|uniref:TonB-dependent receptor domain-containing protein n=1 Tax=Capnocytophaga canimorsus TaxID=28188 RepID=UPI001AD2D8F4|nr:TonB-dependent receptor [Capnocytophaga canimorsus]GIM58502.1 TonB-dependent receptor [Capnocytophaga canimorsus]